MEINITLFYYSKCPEPVTRYLKTEVGAKVSAIKWPISCSYVCYCSEHFLMLLNHLHYLKKKRQMTKISNLDNLQAHHFNLDSFKNKYDPGIDDLSEMLKLSLYQLLWIFLLWDYQSSCWNTWQHDQSNIRQITWRVTIRQVQIW